MYKGKRLSDITASFLGIIILSPLLIIIPLLVLASSGRPIIFRQQRAGKDWKVFNLYKFRTMTAGAEKYGYVCKEDDVRVTSIGRFLRKYKLDELPQLFNVLKGDMSLVGPRPEVLEFAEYYKEQFRKILTVKPGITDLASIQFRNEATFVGNAENTKDYYLKEILPRKTKINSDYLKKTNILFDIYLIFKTLFLLASGRK